MKLEEQRIAIAEWCGFVSGVEEDYPYRREWAKDGRMYCDCDLPDYLNDLNAMHEAESHLKDKAQQDAYCLALAKVSSLVELNYWTHMDVVAWLAMRATAAQRAEALLRTIGKWSDSTLHTKGM